MDASLLVSRCSCPAALSFCLPPLVGGAFRSQGSLWKSPETVVLARPRSLRRGAAMDDGPACSGGDSAPYRGALARLLIAAASSSTPPSRAPSSWRGLTRAPKRPRLVHRLPWSWWFTTIGNRRFSGPKALGSAHWVATPRGCTAPGQSITLPSVQIGLPSVVNTSGTHDTVGREHRRWVGRDDAPPRLTRCAIKLPEPCPRLG
jgi:hypothetical protein